MSNGKRKAPLPMQSSRFGISSLRGSTAIPRVGKPEAEHKQTQVGDREDDRFSGRTPVEEGGRPPRANTLSLHLKRIHQLLSDVDMELNYLGCPPYESSSEEEDEEEDDIPSTQVISDDDVCICDD